jgi:hypothetical protein
VLYALACAAAFAIATPVGGNAVRLGALFAGPVAAATIPRRGLAALLALPLAYWQLQAPVRDVAVASGDRSVEAAYYAPVLRLLDHRPGRVEIPFTRNHWEAARLAPHFPLARGWERQLDIATNPLFYDGRLSAAAYEQWLHANAVSYVALPDARLDYSARREAALVRAGQPFLTPIGRSRHWQLFAVTAPTPLASPPATLSGSSPQGFTLTFAAPGTSDVRIRFTPYWHARGACVSRGPGGFTRVRAARAAVVEVGIEFSLARVFERGPRGACA